MKKILNIALGEISTGELGIALAFAKNLSRAKYDNYFLVPDEKQHIMGKVEYGHVMTVSRSQTPVENHEIIMKYIQANDFDAMVLFDIFTFEYSQDWTGINFDIIRSLGIPIISLDEYEYTKAGYKLDYYGIFVKRLPALLEKCDFIIKNCPLSMIENHDKCFAQGLKKNEYYYRVFDTMNRISEEEKQEIREKYIYSKTGKRNAKIVCLTTSEWEIKGAYAFSCQNTLASWLGNILHEYLKELDEDITLLHLGAENWTIAAQDGQVSYVHYDSFPVDVFERVIQSADLFVTYNLISITLSKAMLFGVPALVLNNSKIIEFDRLKDKLRERPLWYQKMALEVKKVYPFTASMFGWKNFLKFILTDNAYVNTFKSVDMFNYQKTKEILRSMIFDNDMRKQILEDNEKFIKNYKKVRSAEDVLDDIMQQIEQRKYNNDVLRELQCSSEI